MHSFGGSRPYPTNIILKNDGVALEGSGRILDMRQNISATFDSLTSTYLINASGDEASDITVDASSFDKVMSATDTDVQTALDTIDDAFTAFPPNCVSTDDWCMLYESRLVKLYVNTTLQSQWPIQAIDYYLLLDDGASFLLLDDGVAN